LKLDDAMTPVAGASGLSDSIRDAIRRLGARFNPEVLAATRALFGGRWDLSLPREAQLHTDVTYGPDDRNRIDVFASGRRGAPLLVFVPGGGFIAGDKSLYRHVGPAFARLGFVSAIVNYRLAPAHAWPAGAVDVASAIDWLVERAESFGAEASSVYVLAQSAGAAHASGALFDRRLQPRHFARIRSAVLMSGFYRMDASVAAPNIRAYFGDDASKYEDRSPLTAVAGSALPVGLTVAEFDPGYLASQTMALAGELIMRDDRCPPLLWNEDHNHVSPLLSIGAGSGTLAADLAALLLRLGGAANDSRGRDRADA
jgi:acetyl esterase/lipase